MEKFTQFINESKVPPIEGGYTYNDKTHMQHKISKSAAYEAKIALSRNNVNIHDHEAFIRDMHKLIQKHTDVKKKHP